jgi:hypothetical protein
MYQQIKENGIWKSRFNHELYMKPEIVKVIKVGRLKFLGHLCRIQEQDSCRKLAFHKPEGTRQVGTPLIRWLDSVEDDLKIMGFRNWRRKSQDQDQWRAVVEETKVHDGR